MRRFILILEGAVIGIISAYGLLWLWNDWKFRHAPAAAAAVVEQFEVHEIGPHSGVDI